MSTQFRILFSLAIAHDYYRDACPDFNYLIPATTAELLRKGGLVVRMRENKLYVLYEANEDGTPLRSMAARSLRIGLQLSNPGFHFLTDVALPPTVAWRNASAASVLDGAQAMTLARDAFRLVFSGTERPLHLSLQDLNGTVLESVDVDSAHDRSEHAFDLRAYDTGPYLVRETYPGSTRDSLLYREPELHEAGIFGLADIAVDAVFYTTPPEFGIHFNARSETLKYYVVARNYSDADFALLQVSDKGFTEDGRAEIVFERVASADFSPSDTAAELLAGEGEKVMLFRSQNPVARQEASRRKIQLAKNGDVLVSHLPAPGADRAKADFIIHIAKP